GATRRQIDHAHVAPEHARAQAGAERLGAGLLGGEALGIGLSALGAPLGLGPLGCGEDAAEEAFAVSLDRPFDAADVDEVGPDADDHVDVPRPRFMAARMVFTAAAKPENTASPMRKWPMLSSTICGREAIASAVSKLSPWPALTSRPRRGGGVAAWRVRRPSPFPPGRPPSPRASR